MPTAYLEAGLASAPAAAIPDGAAACAPASACPRPMAVPRSIDADRRRLPRVASARSARCPRFSTAGHIDLSVDACSAQFSGHWARCSHRQRELEMQWTPGVEACGLRLEENAELEQGRRISILPIRPPVRFCDRTTGFRLPPGLASRGRHEFELALGGLPSTCAPRPPGAVDPGRSTCWSEDAQLTSQFADRRCPATCRPSPCRSLFRVAW